VTIPPGTVFAMGDNRGNSEDSRFWGPVPIHNVIGKALITYWPPKRVGTL
jgi:signal peptidase I